MLSGREPRYSFQLSFKWRSDNIVFYLDTHLAKAN